MKHALAGLCALLGSTSIAMGATYAQTSSSPNVTTYHNDPARSGLYIVPTLTWARAATAHLEATFKASPGAPVYAQPLYWLPQGRPHGLIIVATMANTVLALDAGSGRQVWQASLGPVVPSSDLPCSPSRGIASTPVIDEAAAALYLDAEILVQNQAKHFVFGLSLKDGSVLPRWPIDLDRALAAKGIAFSSVIQGQRGALALVNGTLYVPFGAPGRDCDAYHGWVVGVSTAAPSVLGAWSTRAERGGIWGVGGVVYDGRSLFVATGNTLGAQVWSDGEAVIRVPFGLHHSTRTIDFFAPSDWLTMDKADRDLGSTAPLPLDVPNSGGGKTALILQMGKDGNAYLLDRLNLGGINGALAVQPVTTSQIKTGPAIFPATDGMFVAIPGAGVNCPPPPLLNVGLTVLKVVASPAPATEVAWCAPLASSGAPIVTTTDGKSNPIVWIVGSEGDELLHGYAGDTGKTVFGGGGPANQMARLRRFATILPVEDRLYVVGDTRVYAFSFGP